MTIYNTYQEAKIANPESEIYKLNGSFTAESNTLWRLCNPADHCVTVEKFLDEKSKGDPDIYRVQHEPNAHLIAAAPEMYEALELMVRYAHMLEEQLLSRRVEVTTLYLDSKNERPPEDVAEDALAKARGE